VDAREERLARNEVLFREVNEQIRMAAEGHGVDAHLYDFFCECSNTDCDFRLSLTLADYEQVRRHSDRFFVAHGHWLPEIEQVVERRDDYDVVAKEGHAARLADALDPRS
jgi:hypothetical protein